MLSNCQNDGCCFAIFLSVLGRRTSPYAFMCRPCRAFFIVGKSKLACNPKNRNLAVPFPFRCFPFLISMKKPVYLIAGAVALLALVVFGIFHFTKHTNEANASKSMVTPDASFTAYVTAYTGRTIRADAPIKVRLASPAFDTIAPNSPAEASLFSFSPSIKGKALWEDTRTVKFIPDDKLPAGQQYQATFSLSKVADTDSEHEDFTFSFQVMPQQFNITFDGLSIPVENQINIMNLTGTVQTADAASPLAIKKVLMASANGSNLDVIWSHFDENTRHVFTVRNIIKEEKAYNLTMGWNGNSLNLEAKGEETFSIPAKSSFMLMQAHVVQFPEQHVSLRFSEPIAAGQNLKGLIKIEGVKDIRTVVSSNEIKVYPLLPQAGTKKVSVFAGLKSTSGKKVNFQINKSVIFRMVKPAVKLVGDGVILPKSKDGLIFPFEAVSLKAVDVQVVQIKEQNVAQFLQVNDLAGNNELVRVGRPVFRKTVPLTAAGIADLTSWKRYNLELSELMEPEPGAIYQVTISFRKGHSAYPAERQTPRQLKPTLFKIWQKTKRWTCRLGMRKRILL